MRERSGTFSCFFCLAGGVMAGGLCFGEATNEDETKIFSAGYKAGFMCSAVFLAKRDPGRCHARGTGR